MFAEQKNLWPPKQTGGDLPWSAETSTQCSVIICVGKESESEDVFMYDWVTEIIPALETDYTSIKLEKKSGLLHTASTHSARTPAPHQGSDITRPPEPGKDSISHGHTHQTRAGSSACIPSHPED